MDKADFIIAEIKKLYSRQPTSTAEKVINATVEHLLIKVETAYPQSYSFDDMMPDVRADPKIRSDFASRMKTKSPPAGAG